MRNRSRRWAERAVLGLMIVIGVLVLVADPLGWLDRFLPGDAIPKVILLVLCTVTLFLLLEMERFEALDDIHSTIAKLDIDGLSRELKDKRYAGVTRVASRFSETSFDDCVRSAEDIGILNTWMPNLDELVPSLKVALARNATVRILLLFPGSDVAQLRDEALRRTLPNDERGGYVQESVAGGVRRNFAFLEGLAEGIVRHGNGKLEVRVYNSLPSISIYRADEHYFVGLFLHGKLAIQSPQIEIDGTNTVLGKHVQEEFETLWAAGQPIDPMDWQRELNNAPF